MANFETGIVVGSVVYAPGRKIPGGGFSRWVGDYAVEYTVGEPCDWATLGSIMGPQESAYTRAQLSHHNYQKYAKGKIDGIVIHCQDCGKPCTKGRGGFTLTRKTVVCGKCYNEDKHGQPSTVTNYV